MTIPNTHAGKAIKNIAERIPLRDEFLRFSADLFGESDRGCALIGGAWLEDALGSLLRAFVVDDAAVANKLMGFDGAFGSFSQRTDVCFALGLISAVSETT